MKPGDQNAGSTLSCFAVFMGVMSSVSPERRDGSAGRALVTLAFLSSPICLSVQPFPAARHPGPA